MILKSTEPKVIEKSGEECRSVAEFFRLWENIRTRVSVSLDIHRTATLCNFNVDCVFIFGEWYLKIILSGT